VNPVSIVDPNGLRIGSLSIPNGDICKKSTHQCGIELDDKLAKCSLNPNPWGQYMCRKNAEAAFLKCTG
jgi:hypothetical protein